MMMIKMDDNAPVMAATIVVIMAPAGLLSRVNVFT